MEKKPLRNMDIIIHNKNFSINTDEDEKLIFQAANLVDSLLKNISNEIKIESSDTQLVVLIALQLATKLIKKHKILNNWRIKTDKLGSLINI
ncbi:cell division protein ZapA [Candidatus Babeliales bacterium]|nr:cell division protein ZapA [Candidatus Babeliales bacterium]MCF7899430.1 cell division protein ZapA [Candidatus Babeliales bacterium]